jgi:hypothetical protein
MILASGAEAQTKLAQFVEYYPVYNETFESLKKRIESLCGLLYRAYGLRYKNHSEIQVHPRHHRFLGELHTQVYLARLKGQKRTVQYPDILEFVKSQAPARVLYLINYIYE